MQPVVLVTFFSRCGATESLALAAAVGAVQGRALIRLRRLPDAASSAAPASSDCREALDRMHKEYVAPTEADVLGADALILGAPSGFTAASPEWAGFLATLTRLQAQGRLAGKVGAVVDVGGEGTEASFAAAIGQLGFTPPSAEAPTSADLKERAIRLGRRVADTSRALKQAIG